MKKKELSGSQFRSGFRRDKRLRHGLYSKAVTRYRELDQEVRNCSDPTPEMCFKLGNALIEALKVVTRATDVTKNESRARYSSFLSSTSETSQFLSDEGSKTIRKSNAILERLGIKSVP